jgi:hypothetical protein
LFSGLLRVYSYLFALAASLVLIAVSGLAFLSNVHTLNLPMLPWDGRELTWWLFGSGVAGLLAALLAIAGRLRALLLVWTLYAAALLVRGFVFTPYRFRTQSEFEWAMWLLGASVLAVLGAAFAARKGRKKPRRGMR